MNQNNHEIKSRDGFQSKWGFIMAAAGSAVGLGNLWRFPKEVGLNGGGAFVLLYLFFILLIGTTMVIAEFAIGRRGRGSVVECYGAAGKKFKWLGYLSVLTVVLLLSFYAIIGGWTIFYTFKATFGGLLSLPADQMGGVFGGLVSNTGKLALYQVAFLCATAFIVSRGISGGIEKFSKVLMPVLLILMVIVAIRSVTLPGAMEGVVWYLKPDFSVINGTVVVNALGQAFFSLSLGAGAMVTYASYLDRETDLGSTALSVAVADTSVALLAGFITIPAVFAFSLEVGEGPGLVFITLPQVFASLPMGTAFAFAFFFLLFVAALTSSISMLEVMVSFVEEKVKLSRAKLAWLCTAIIFIIGVPPLLSFGPLSGVLIGGKNLLDAYDYFVSSFSLPLVGLFTSIIIGHVWKKEDALDELTSGGVYNRSINNLWYALTRYVVPIILLGIYLRALGIIKF